MEPVHRPAHPRRPGNGVILRQARIAAGLTQAELGLRTAYSAATISRFETGRRPLSDVEVLRTFAAALNIPPAVLGLAAPAGTDPTRARESRAAGDSAASVTGIPIEAGGEDVVQRRELLAGLMGLAGAAALGRSVDAPAAAGAPDDLIARRVESLLVGPLRSAAPVPVAQLTRAVAGAWSLFDGCRYRELAVELPGLVAVAAATADGGSGYGREVAHGLLADGYRIAAELSVKIGDDGLSLLAADRARAAARTSGDPAVVAGSARSVAIALRRLGHREAATDLLRRTAAELPGKSRTDLRAAAGLLCTAAYSTAQQGRHSGAVSLIAEAEEVADRLHRLDTRSALRLNTDIYRIGIHTSLGESGTALRHASAVRVRELPTAERRARFLVDTARAWDAHGRTDKAYAYLVAAERQAPEDLRRPSVAAFVQGMVHGPGRHPAGLRALAGRVGGQVSNL